MKEELCNNIIYFTMNLPPRICQGVCDLCKCAGEGEMPRPAWKYWGPRIPRGPEFHSGPPSRTEAHQEMSRTQEATSFLIKHVGWRVGDKSCEHTEPCVSVKLLSPVPWGLLGCPVKVKGNSHAVLVGKAKCSNTLESGNSTQEK